MELDTVGKRLKFARKAHTPELTQAQLAEMTGIRQATISRLERGVFCDTKFVVEIAMALGVNTEWLSRGLGVMKNKPNKTKSQLQRLEKVLDGMNISESDIERIIDIAILEASKINNK
ncbi:TPA: helix-turn-helix domain-containing protein [Photobacterium damselae]